MGKRIISSGEFIDRFVECLEKGEEFKLENYIVRGDIDILDIYKRIKEKIKDKYRLKELIIEKDGELFDKRIIINVDINIYIFGVEFNDEFRMSSIINGKRIKITIAFKGSAYFVSSTFKGVTVFSETIFEGEVDFARATFEEIVLFDRVTFNEDANFWSVTFNKGAYFEHTIFKKVAFFREAKFNYTELTEFRYVVFEEDANFKNMRGKLEFYNSSFKSLADFRDICFNLILFVDCTFEDLALFKKGKIKFEKYESNRINLKKPDKEWICTIINMIKDECLAIFLNTQFLNKHTKIEDFPLSKTSFLKTDVREVMILCDINKEEIFSHKLLKIKENKKDKDRKLENKLKELLDVYYEIFINQFDYKSVLAEYRNLRISIENNRTYIEASNLYTMEMELIKEFSDSRFERFAIWFYGVISDYGESIKKPIIFMFGLVIFTPLILTLTVKYLELYVKIMTILNLILYPPSIIAYFVLSPYINSLLNTLIAYAPEDVSNFALTYSNYTKAVLGAKFYTGNGTSLLEIIIFCIYSIFMMITTANLYIALRRKLSRK